MTHLLDYCIVGLIVVSALGYAAASLGPKSWRQGLLGGVARAAGRMPRWFGLKGVSARMGFAATQSKGGCGGCDNCASAAPASNTAADAEVSIRVGEIGRRVTH